MYAWMVGRLVRRTFSRMSQGEWSAALRLFADDCHFVFPGRHELAGEYRRKEDIAGWFARAWGLFEIQFEIHDVVVKGPPWRTRVCTRFTGRVTCSDGRTFLNNGMQYVRLSWGKVTQDQLYEDTQTVAEAIEYQRGLEAAPA
jgi:ketosteroid isomerase-like protein